MRAGTVEGRVSSRERGSGTERLLRRQAGVISRAQAVDAGLSPDAVDRRLAARRWLPVHPRVYRDRAHPPSDAARVWAAVLWAGEGAVLSGVAAEWWHRPVGALTGPVTVTVPRRRSPRPRPDVEVRRRDLPAADRMSLRGLAVTAPALTALEAAVESGVSGARFHDRAVRAGLDVDEVSRAYSRGLGCAGSASMRTLLVGAAERSDSVARRLLVRRLRTARLVGWRTAHPVPGLGPAVAFPQVRIAIQVEGWAGHLDSDRRGADAWRRSVASRSGWTVLRYSWQDLTSRPAVVVAEIGDAVATVRRAC